MNIEKRRFGFWLMVSGIVVLAAHAIIRLVQYFNEANGFSGLFWFVLASLIINLLISSVIVYFMLKSPKKAGLLSIVFISLALISVMIPAFSDSDIFVQVVGGLLGYALLLVGSVMIYLDSKTLTTY